MWQLLRDGLLRTHFWRTRSATGGSTTTIVNANDTTIDDDSAYTGGTALILRDSGGNGAAPEGEMARISSYSGATNTFTLSDTLTAAVASGDRYAVATNRIELEEYKELINDALSTIDVVSVDTSITSASGQSEYTLPVALKQHDLYKVEYVGNPNDADDQAWVTVYNWTVVPSTPGAASTLILPALPDGRTVRITYKSKHPRVEDFDDPISEYIDPILARALFVERIYNRLDEETQHQADPFREGYNKAKAELEEAQLMYPIEYPQRQGASGLVIGTRRR